jgi:predicted RNA-binding protein with RPS1 domain
MKSNSVHFFAKNSNNFYIMDENMQIKVLKIDPSQKKRLKLESTLDLSNNTKNTWDSVASSSTIVTSSTIY